jgi:guanylate kinase
MLSPDPLIVVGPSGVGKTFLLNELVTRYPFGKIISNTTRAPRPGEKEGDDFHFATQAEFQAYQAGSDMFVFLEYGGNHYSYLQSDVQAVRDKGLIPLCIVGSNAVVQFLTAYPNAKSIFLRPIDLRFILERLQKRGDTEEQVKKRLQIAADELQFIEFNRHLFHQIFVVENNDISWILEKIKDMYQL